MVLDCIIPDLCLLSCFDEKLFERKSKPVSDELMLNQGAFTDDKWVENKEIKELNALLMKPNYAKVVKNYSSISEGNHVSPHVN